MLKRNVASQQCHVALERQTRGGVGIERGGGIQEFSCHRRLTTNDQTFLLSVAVAIAIIAIRLRLRSGDNYDEAAASRQRRLSSPPYTADPPLRRPIVTARIPVRRVRRGMRFLCIQAV